MYYDRAGQAITRERWSALFGDRAYQVVAQTVLAHVWVSTVWLGLDHGHGPLAPVIFETMVFRRELDNDLMRLADVVLGPDDLGRDLDSERYVTEEDARRGHDAMVARWVDKQAD